jgi:ATP-dependent Lon protease
MTSADALQARSHSVTISVSPMSVSPMTAQHIPLFPLTVVLFPGMTLPLHIFEPRYKRMMKTVIDEEIPFGVVLARESGIATVGCTAIVRDVARTYPDGRMDIVTTGESAYRVRGVHKDKEYLEATVELMAEDLQPGPSSAATELLTLFTDCHLLLHGSPPGEIDINDQDDGLLSYRIAGELPLELETLQELLEMRVEAERRLKLIGRLNQLLPQLVQIQQIRSKAAANNHGPN